MNGIHVESLEVAVTEHCNLRCAACDHASPHLAKAFLAVEELAADLDALRTCVRADEFRLVGGEPLQHPALDEIIATVRRSGIAERIVLISNGAILHRAEPKIWRAIDKLWLSIYPGIRMRLTLNAIEALCLRYDVIFDPRQIDSFRRTLLNQPNPDGELVERIYATCKMAHEWKCYTLSNGRFYKCSPPPTLRQRLALAGTDYRDEPHDSVALHPTSSLKERLQLYLDSTEPLDACRFCLGTLGPDIAHRQLNRTGLQAELASNGADDLDHVRANLGSAAAI